KFRLSEKYCGFRRHLIHQRRADRAGLPLFLLPSPVSAVVAWAAPTNSGHHLFIIAGVAHATAFVFDKVQAV
ncbi:MAG: hypothetical protein Q4G28_01025, partial [Neisseria sp.]|nr:hypothetical protein [Neisseria sp.]